MGTLSNVFTDNYLQKKADERQSIAPKPLTSLPLASLPKITTKTSTPSTINSKASFVDKVASSEQLTPLANLKKITAVKTPVQPINAISPVIKTTPYKPLSVKEESLSLPKDLRNTTLPIASKEVEISPVESFKKIAKSLIEPYTNPSESVKSLERQYGFIPNKPESTLDRVADVVSAPLRTIGKAVTRTIGGATEGYKNDLVEAIASYELTKKIKSGEVPLNVLDELEVLKKTYPQIAGDAALAVMSVYTPALLSKTAVNVAGKPVLSAILEGGIQSIPAGAGFGVAQAAASGSKDPKEIASIIGQSIAINGILGSIISGVIPAGAELSNRAQKIHNEIKLDAMSKGWSEAEAIKIANTGGYKGGVPKKGEGQLDLFESKSNELPKINNNDPVVVNSVEESPGVTRHTLNIPGKNAEMDLLQTGNKLSVIIPEISKKNRGQGYGKQLYLKAIKIANKNNLVLEGGKTITEGAARVWESLIKDGYDIKKNTNVQKTNIGEIITTNKEPVYSYTPSTFKESLNTITEILPNIGTRNFESMTFNLDKFKNNKISTDNQLIQEAKKYRSEKEFKKVFTKQLDETGHNPITGGDYLYHVSEQPDLKVIDGQKSMNGTTYAYGNAPSSDRTGTVYMIDKSKIKPENISSRGGEYHILGEIPQDAFINLGTKGKESFDVYRAIWEKANKINEPSATVPALPKITTKSLVQETKYKGVYEKIVEELDAQHPLRKAQDAIYSKDRGRKIAAGSNIAKSVGGQEGFYAEKGALKGASEKIKSEGLSGKLSQEEIDAIFNDIRNYDWGNKRFQGTNAQDGFDRLLNGELIRDSEKKQLVKVIPRELIDVMDEVNKSLSDVDKAVIKVKRAMKDPDTLVNNLKEDIASYNERKIKLGKVKEITPDQEVTIKEKIKEINSIEDPKQKVQKFKELEDYMNSFVPSNISDIFINTWKAGLLTGIKTSGLNIMSNISHGTTEILKDLPASIVDIALTGSKKAYNTIPFLPDIKVPGRTTSFTLKGVTSGIAKGFKKGMEFMKSGIDERNTLDNIGMKKINMGSGVVSKGIQAYVNFVFKLMGAEDQPFYYGAYSHSLYKQAIAKAKNEGYSMLKSPKARNEFVKNIVENPTKEIAEAAHQDALTAVFQNDNKLVEFVKSAQRLGKDQKVPIGEIAIPFGKTPANVGLQIIKYTPVGTMATLANQVRKGTYDQRIIADAIGRGAVGSGILWLGYMMSQQNLISTDRPSGEREQKQRELEGKPQNSWYDPITKKWRSIGVFGPAGSLLILGAQFQEKYRESGSISKAALAAGLGGIKSFGEQPFVKGVNQIAEGFSNPERYASQLASGYVSSLVPTIVSDIARSIDTKDGRVTERRTDGIKDSIVARLPVIRTKLEPRIDVLGKEVQNASPLEVLIDPTRPSELGSSPTVDELKRLFRAGHPATPTLLSDKKSGFDSLTPKNNTDLWKYTGETIDFNLGKLINSNNISEDFELDEKQYGNNTPYKNLPDELKAKAINNVVNKLKDYTRAIFVMEITKDLSGSELLNRLAEYRDSGLFTRDVANIYERLTRPQE